MRYRNILFNLFKKYLLIFIFKFFKTFYEDIKALIYWLFFLRNIKGDIFYDLDNAPSTFGDFSYTIFLAAAISKRNHKNIIIEYSNNIRVNKKWKYLNSSGITQRIESLKNYGEFLLDHIKADKKITIKIQKKVKEKKYNKLSFLFKYSYITIIKLCFLIWQFSDFSKIIGYKIIPFSSIKEKNPINKEKKYIAIVVRKELKKELSVWYNTNPDFLKMLVFTCRKYTSLPIVIVSDLIGCNFAKKYLFNEKQIYFSSDYGGIKESIKLLVESKLCIQKDGGGICVPFLFSETPYFVSMWPAHLSIFYNLFKLNKKNNLQIFEKRISDDLFIKSLRIFLKNNQKMINQEGNFGN